MNCTSCRGPLTHVYLYFAAGRDTTAATLTFIFYFLASYPDVLARLRDEIISKIGPNRRPDYDDIRDMKYLRAVINGEHPPVLRYVQYTEC